jgi:galactose-1-phosphate uridylyltransferase
MGIGYSIINTVALPFTLKMYLKAKEEELWKLRYFTMQKIHLIFKKKSSKRKTKNPSRNLYNSIITNISSFNTSQNYHLSKILI